MIPMETSQLTQASDRCRLKKVKCDGVVPACTNCSAAGVACVVSAKLRRKTKIRGFQQPPSDELVRKLQAENDELRRALITEKETSASLRARVELGAGTHIENVHGSTTAARPASHRHPPNSTSAIIKHMGRMVPDAHGSERFSGSTSGVHFILSVQQSLQARRLWMLPFPESCFCLHLLETCPACEISFEFGGLLSADASTRGPHFSGVAILPSIVWDPPSAAAPQRQDPVETLAVLFHLCIVLVFNAMASSNLSSNDNDAHSHVHEHLAVIHAAVPHFIVKGDMSSLRSLILFAFYLQVSNQPLLMVSMNGILVRLAQSQGLHRHNRRFKLVHGQIETRKRMWWWIYMFDKVVSIIHGLPRLITDDDVDVDYPLDCELNETSATAPAFPLPGETTPVSGFTTYVQLGRILSDMLAELYTTTKRRRGAEKIAALQNAVQAWRQRTHWPPDADGTDAAESPDHADTLGSPDSDSHAKMALWTAFMAHLTTLLIHRPALTFDDTTAPFAESLRVCAEASAAILRLLGSQAGRTILGIAPAGPGLILQCGLIHVFYRVTMHGRGQDALDDQNERDSQGDPLDLARQLLAGYRPTPFRNYEELLSLGLD
ncbi:hypothetical protein SEUCBS139899_007878 [Sporothrix eucalyptigena]